MEKPERKVKRCYIYARVSTEEQAKGQYTSIEAQEDRCKHAIAIKQDQGWIHAGTIKDPGYSGKDMNRPGMQKLLSLIRSGQVDVILTYRIDRLSRSILAFYDFHGLLEKQHVELFSITESFDTSTTVGRLMLNIILSFAQYERELAQERTLHKMQQHAEKGFWTGGMLPYGYELAGTDGNGSTKRILQIVEDEAENVRLMYKLYLQKQNVAAICKTLNDRGIRTRVRTLTSRGGEQRKGGGKYFYETAVMKILRNPLYTGKIRYRDKVFPGQHPAIIGEKTWNAVQRLLDKNARQTMIETRDDHTHLLKGLIKCGACGGNTYTPYPSGKKDPKTGKPYLYYACTTFTKYGTKGGCPVRMLPARPFENTIRHFLQALAHDNVTLEKAIEEANRNSDRTLKPMMKTRDELVGRRKKLTSQINNYVEIIGEKGLESTELREKYERCIRERDALDRQLETLNIEIASAERTVLDMKVIQANLKAFDRLMGKLPMEDQKDLCHLLIKRITVWPFDPAKDKAPKEKGSFVTGMEPRPGRRNKLLLVQIELYEIQGLDLPASTTLAKFGFASKWLPGRDSNPQQTG